MKGHKIWAFLLVIVIGVGIGAFYFLNSYYEKPEDALAKAMQAVVDKNQSVAEQYLDYQTLCDMDNHDGEKEIYAMIMRDFNYEIKDVTQDDGEAVAELTVHNRNIEQIYNQFVVSAYELVISDAYQPENEKIGEEKMKAEIDAMLLKSLTEMTTDTRISNISVQMIRKGRSWYIHFDNEDYDAIYGGYLSAQKAAGNVLGDRSTESLKKLESAYEQKIDDTKHTLRNAAHYMTDDVWNGQLVHIVSAINAGTDVEGNDYDLAAGIEALKKTLTERAQYDTYIAELDDTYYAEVKSAWSELTAACDRLVSEIEAENPEKIDANYIPNTDELTEAMNKFVSIVYPNN